MKKGYKKFLINRILPGNIIFILNSIFFYVILDVQFALSLKLAIAYVGALSFTTLFMYITYSASWTANQYRYNKLTSKKWLY